MAFGVNPMKNIPFIELGCRSNFSFLKGASHAHELVSQGKQIGLSAIGIADNNTLAGIVRAYSAERIQNFKTYLGSRVTLYKTPEGNGFTLLELPFKLILYPSSLTSYNNLSNLLTDGKLRSSSGDCYLFLSDLEKYSNGIHAIILLKNIKDKSLIQHLDHLKSIFSHDRLSLALENNFSKHSYKLISLTKDISQLTNIPLLATNNVLAHAPDRLILSEILIAIKNKVPIEDSPLYTKQNRENYLKSPDAINKIFKDTPQAIYRSLEVAEYIKNFSLSELKYNYPNSINSNLTPKDRLKELTKEGLNRRYSNNIPEKISILVKKELEVISDLKYENYFLTVYDILTFAKKNNILFQGRGAAANSAVCFALEITAVDPEKVNLLFERFISRERQEPPDIDIDFEHERREEVIQHIYETYGRRKAALVCEVVSYRTKSAIRDIGKVFSIKDEELDILSKLAHRYKDKTELKEKLESHGLNPQCPKIKLTLLFTKELIGFPRHISQHVGGFVISDSLISDLVPIRPATMPGRTIIEWDKDDIEELGILKIDVLALGMLTMISKAFNLLKLPFKPTLYNIPEEDSKVYEMISRADTIGVFQIESRAQMSMLPRLQPKTFYDLVVEVAIVRPGPIRGNMVHPYLKRRMGRENVVYPSKEVEHVLKSTLGIPIFQEQVMELSVVAGGFTPGEADQLRRAMASWKRNVNKMEAFKEKLVSGMKHRGYRDDFINQILEQIKGFGEYGFPQSHAASFAQIVYVSAWIKCHHPEVFLTSILNSQPMGFYGPSQLIQDAKRHGVEVLPIDINHSFWDCTLEAKNSPKIQSVRIGFRLISGLQENEAEKIYLERTNGIYSSIYNLWTRSKISIPTLKALARADAFSSLGISRQSALWEIQKYKDKPMPLFKSLEASSYEIITPLPKTSLLSETLKDYSISNFSEKAHPISFLRNYLKEKNVTEIIRCSLDQALHNHLIKVAGLIIVRQRPPTAHGTTFLTIEDETEILNIIVKPDVFKEYRDEICDSQALLISGILQKLDGVTNLIAKEIQVLDYFFEDLDTRARNFH